MGGGGKGLGAPLEIEKQKKSIRANFKLFDLYFDTFLIGNMLHVYVMCCYLF